MAYSELIKNFNNIREYLREFYVYGFKSRDEYTKKSARSYDDERRRLESWLGDYMQFRRTPEGKNVFLSIDSRVTKHNPLYAAWKTKSFTDGDITLHFILFDILYSPEISKTLNEITEEIDSRLQAFEEPKVFDSSTVRKKLKEYVSEGIIVSEKIGKTMYYKRAEETKIPNSDILDFFSETAPCGVIGSYLLDKQKKNKSPFAFKHHYITSTMDSEILCALLAAISEKKKITVVSINRHRERISENEITPLKVLISAQNGRQHVMAYNPRIDRVVSFRIDNIISVKINDTDEDFDRQREKLDEIQKHMWGVTVHRPGAKKLDHVEFTVRYDADEIHIHQRLVREKRCGTVEKISVNESKFTADVFDAGELIPWIRTFICRITEINISNKELEKQFKDDIEAMYAIYDLEGGENQ